MNKQQIQALIDAKIAGQGSAVDVGGALPTILHEILEAAFAGANVQSNWNESDSESPQYIQNKPTIPAAQVNADWDAVEGVASILNKPTIPAAPVQSDWTEADTESLAFIKNKPTIPQGATIITGATFIMDSSTVESIQVPNTVSKELVAQAYEQGGTVRIFDSIGNCAQIVAWGGLGDADRGLAFAAAYTRIVPVTFLG